MPVPVCAPSQNDACARFAYTFGRDGDEDDEGGPVIKFNSIGARKVADDNIDLTDKMELLDLFEERVGVRFEGVSIFRAIYDDSSYVTVQGELHPRDGTELEVDVEVVAAAYDTKGRIVGTSANTFYTESFFGLEIFEITIAVPPSSDIVRVRLYPKKG